MKRLGQVSEVDWIKFFIHFYTIFCIHLESWNNTREKREEKKNSRRWFFYKNKLLMSEKFSHRVQSFVIGFTQKKSWEQLDWENSSARMRNKWILMRRCREWDEMFLKFFSLIEIECWLFDYLDIVNWVKMTTSKKC